MRQTGHKIVCAAKKKEERVGHGVRTVCPQWLSVPFQVSLPSKGTTRGPGAIGNSYEAALLEIKTPKPTRLFVSTNYYKYSTSSYPGSSGTLINSIHECFGPRVTSTYSTRTIATSAPLILCCRLETQHLPHTTATK